MAALDSIVSLLRERMGLEIASIGISSLESAVRERMDALELKSVGAYALLLLRDEAEQQALIERVVVPETWFFREVAAFRMLEKWVLARRLRSVRALSVPCSTGEEPYSIGMALLDVAIKPEVHALDISARALRVARKGEYTRNSFRGADLGYRERYFRKQTDGSYALDQRVRDCVNFEESNALFLKTDVGRQAYDVIFCRNLLIYMHERSRQKLLNTLRNFLKPGGIIFSGHAEFKIMTENGFVRQGEHRAFAFVPKPEEIPARRGAVVATIEEP